MNVRSSDPALRVFALCALVVAFGTLAFFATQTDTVVGDGRASSAVIDACPAYNLFRKEQDGTISPDEVTELNARRKQLEELKLGQGVWL